MIEIMSPAGSYESLMAAINAGANSVYFGVTQLNMRARSANNFDVEDLKKICRICHEKKVKPYLTLNTILYDHDMILMKKLIDAAKASKVSAIIISDPAAMMYAKQVGMEVHISTQANVSNFETLKFYSQFADVVVLARELTLKQIAEIVHRIKQEKVCGPSGKQIRVELFAHGAMCVSISGKCYMSLATYNASANRGVCLQNCRRKYKITDDETGESLVIDNEYVMSPKDLCTIGFLDKIVAAGVSVLKIEGRGRSPDYVDVTTRCYRQAADSIAESSYTKDKIDGWLTELKTVYNRGFWDGYYLGKRLDAWSGEYGSQATQEKQFLGLIRNYYKRPKAAEAYLEAGSLAEKDEIMITGPTTGVLRLKAVSLMVDEGKIKTAKQRSIVTFECKDTVRKNDKLYVLRRTR